MPCLAHRGPHSVHTGSTGGDKERRQSLNGGNKESLNVYDTGDHYQSVLEHSECGNEVLWA